YILYSFLVLLSIDPDSPLSPFIFFFYCSAAPPILPSFPTRRSSDLAWPCAWSTTRWAEGRRADGPSSGGRCRHDRRLALVTRHRSEEHTSELQSLTNLVCRLLLEKKKNKHTTRR